ncbi:MAG TPA: hypothetical protein VK978_01300, partial [Candidatus Saccharimonadales bacterium]|nr:hypothetical protein [Candidatus Saccharimonadales bacterium]
MDNQRAQVVEKLKASNNFLVTVSRDPSVDALAACIGLTLLLNKLNKQATAVFSGEVPSAIRFLKPDKTLQKNADSLQDFIISLDKSKADKLRYKVEDDVVRIFITPYKTSLSSRDLSYSKGDFNVDVVIALGVSRREDLDTAIAGHGRILHDATVISITNTENAQLGTLHLEDTAASGMSELITHMSDELGYGLFDDQIATALLTGLVAATEHFGNAKTTPMTLTAAADLLEAGANQQLVSAQLAQRPGGVKPGQNQGQGQGQNQNQPLKSYKQISREQHRDEKSDKPDERRESPKPAQQGRQEGDRPEPTSRGSRRVDPTMSTAPAPPAPDSDIRSLLQQADEQS